MAERLQIITNREMLSLPLQGGIVEAHPDDWVMFGAQKNLGLTVVTLTDGADRNHPNYPKNLLRETRRNEGAIANKIAGYANWYPGDLPDGYLQEFEDEGVSTLSEIVDRDKLQYLIAPNPDDEHPDHAAAARIAQKVAGDEISLYYKDTISGINKYGEHVIPTHYIPLSRNDVRRRRRGYFANESQTQAIPYNEMLDVFSVLAMPKRRGKDIGVPFAATLVKETVGNPADPIADALGDQVILRSSEGLFVASRELQPSGR